MVNTILKEADLFCPNSVRINFTIYQITKLPDTFSGEYLKSVKALTNRYATIDVKKKKLVNCKIFTLMDVDDCKDISVKNNYLNGHISGIGEHELKPFVEPIYCKENFEEVLKDIHFPYIAKTNRQKHRYVEVFDPSTGILTDEESIAKLRDQCASSAKTNLEQFLTYRLENQPVL
ncbi:hypothetical protein [Levilactobacillus brevis]|uniref:hypothetical protein n=1 Tax=Levilactobacillus brevis TaxID=1580 RepID=UPI000A61C99A|nr:hypothetical protein [Levilactobacillus brevis]